MLHECQKSGGSGVTVEYIRTASIGDPIVIDIGPNSAYYQEDYQSLTVNNFIVVPTADINLSASTSNAQYAANITVSARAIRKESISYVASTGRLTITKSLTAVLFRSGSSVLTATGDNVNFDIYVIRPGLDVIKGS